MSYTKQSWSDTESSGTSITATKLNNIETGIYNAHTKLDAIEDYIVKVGTTASWYYEQYNSGRMHMRGRVSQGVKGGTSWGNIYYDSAQKGGWTYPVAFKSIKSAIITAERSDGDLWVTQTTQGTTTTAPKCFAITSTKNSESKTTYFHVDVWGTWK